MEFVADDQARTVENAVVIGIPPFDAHRIKHQRIALPVSDRVTAVGWPPIFRSGMLPPVGINPDNVWSILRENPDLLGPDHKFIDVRDVQDPWITGRITTAGERIRKPALFNEFNILLIYSFPFRVIWRKFPHT